MKQLRLDAVWWLVSPQNPLKSVAGMAPFAERLAGARRLATHPRIRVSDVERRAGTRFTVDTLAVLRRRFAGCRFVWLMGADNLRQITRWRRWRRIFELAAIAVVDRPGQTQRALAGQAAARFRRRRLPDRAAKALAAARLPAWLLLRGLNDPTSATALRRDRTGR
jgi:nicotinate-nucleotide adenylyltransferase